MDAKPLDAAAELFWEEFAGRMPFQVGGVEIGRDSVSYRYRYEVAGARNSGEWIHRAQGAQDLRRGQLDRGR